MVDSGAMVCWIYVEQGFKGSACAGFWGCCVGFWGTLLHLEARFCAAVGGHLVAWGFRGVGFRGVGFKGASCRSDGETHSSGFCHVCAWVQGFATWHPEPFGGPYMKPS